MPRCHSTIAFILLWASACTSWRPGSDCERGLLFDSDREGRPSIYVITDTGGTATILTPASGAASFSRVPDYSPDGRQIVFHGRRDSIEGLFVITCRGGAAVPLPNTSGASAPAWSPDGKRIAFVRGVRIFTLELRSGVVERVLMIPDSSFYPAWSPDGSMLAFVSKGPATWEIFVANISDGSVRQLTQAPAAEVASQGPAWSPDGRRIAFDRKQGDQFHIYVMNSDGSDIRQLTHGPAVHARPAWSPDGHSIAFHATRDRPNGAPMGDLQYFELYIMSADGGPMRRVTTNDRFDGHPEWW